MAGRPPKPLDMSTKHYTKEEIDARKKAEEKLKTGSDKVYKAPKNLAKPVKAIYKELVEKLRPLDILTDLDIDLVAMTANAIYQIQKAQEEIDRVGLVTYTYDFEGNIIGSKKNQMVDVLKIYQNIFKDGCAALCLSPSARAKLSVELANATTLEKKDNEIDDMFGGL